jgi:segregation and condensation protein A
MLQQRLLQIEVGLGYNNFNVGERDPNEVEELRLEEQEA